MYSVEFTRSAKREFFSLPVEIQDRVLDAIEKLRRNPKTPAVQTRKLAGTDPLFRFRVGDYRVVYELRARQLIILVIKIGHRREVYREL
jgi:mRNA interferase RelE/StbE